MTEFSVVIANKKILLLESFSSCQDLIVLHVGWTTYIHFMTLILSQTFEIISTDDNLLVGVW